MTTTYTDELARLIATGYGVCIECGRDLPDRQATNLYCADCIDEVPTG